MSAEIERAVHAYSRMLFQICVVLLCNEQDAEDALQECFIRYCRKAPAFNGAEHEKAWLIKVATNICRDMRRFRWRREAPRRYAFMDGHEGASPEKSDILETVMTLPLKEKTVLVLHYIEGYTIHEMAKLLGASEAAVKKRLQRARERLKLEY